VYERADSYTHIDRLGRKLMKALQDAIEDARAKAHVTGCNSMAKLHLLKHEIETKDLKSLVTNADRQAEREYFRHLISKGILAMMPSEVHFYVSLTHKEEESQSTVAATQEFLKSLR